MIGVYFETWASKWASVGDQLDLSFIKADVVYLAFCNPSTLYENRNSFAGTGLDFSSDFKTVVVAIDILKSYGKKVMLSVGGSTYQFHDVNYGKVVSLMEDLHCDGIDIDWEPQDGIKSALEFEKIITGFRTCLGIQTGKYLTAAVFSTGAAPLKVDDIYSGMNVKGLTSAGSKLNWINLMGYDAGKEFDVKNAYDQYKKVYDGVVNVGIELGKQGWGDAIVDEAYVRKVKALKFDGYFIWGFGSVVNVGIKYDAALDILMEKKIVIVPKNNPTSDAVKGITCPMNCPWCSKTITVGLKKFDVGSLVFKNVSETIDLTGGQ